VQKILLLLIVLAISISCGSEDQPEPGSSFQMKPRGEVFSVSSELEKLNASTFFIKSNSDRYPPHNSWKSFTRLMKEVSIFDATTKKIMAALCSGDTNKSVLIVGEPSEAYRYIFSRLPFITRQGCNQQIHAEINISKIEEGRKYVGEVEKYWNEYIVSPSEKHDVVLYLKNLGMLIGLGSHSHDSTGIEAEYASNISSGRIKSVAFINKYEFNKLQFSEHAYVLASFAETITLDAPGSLKVGQLAQKYLEVLHPQLSISKSNLDYLVKMTSYYRPNITEPGRTIQILKSMIREYEGELNTAEKSVNFETKHPYNSRSNISRVIKFDGVESISLSFTRFETQSDADYLSIIDGETNIELDKLSGDKGAFETKFYPSAHLILKFSSNLSVQSWGFDLKKVTVVKSGKKEFTRDQVRRSLLSTAQLPEWLIDKKFDVIKGLGKKLDLDVVGVSEGKKDVIRLSKIGYVAGRTDKKPIASALLVGPTGTGKSYLAKKVSEYLGLGLVTFDMTSYRTDESFDRFLEVLSNYLILYPYSVYLFEEIDKASIKILDRLYFMLDEGIFYDKYQRPLFARGAYIMMTTNMASDTIIKNKDNPKLRELVDLKLQKSFRPSFLNRFDAITLFKPFSDAEFVKLAKIMVGKKVRLLKERFGWDLTIDSATISYLGQKGKSSVFGARPMERLIESVISVGIAEWQLANGSIPEKGHISITQVSGKDQYYKITDGSRSVLEYHVVPKNNSGFIQSILESIFRQNRSLN